MPLVERPTYIDMVIPDGAGASVARACKAASPMMGVIGGALVGAVAAYYVPQLLDRFARPPESENVSLDVEPRDD